MGVAYSWIAVQGVDLGTLTDSLGLEPFGVERLASDVPDLGFAELPEGWLVLVQADAAAAFRRPLVNAAALGPAVSCSEEPTRAEVRYYEGGLETWRVIADGQVPDILSVAGEPPDMFDALLEMAGEDIFYETPRTQVLEAYRDVALNLALCICGFRLSAPPGGLGWTELRPRGLERAEVR